MEQVSTWRMAEKKCWNEAGGGVSTAILTVSLQRCLFSSLVEKTRRRPAASPKKGTRPAPLTFTTTPKPSGARATKAAATLSSNPLPTPAAPRRLGPQHRQETQTPNRPSTEAPLGGQPTSTAPRAGATTATTTRHEIARRSVDGLNKACLNVMHTDTDRTEISLPEINDSRVSPS